MTEQNHGKIKIKIADVMKEKQISKTKLTYLAFLQLRQLNNLINEKAARVDFDVLARICNALDCKIEDILEYVPADPEGQEEDNKLTTPVQALKFCARFLRHRSQNLPFLLVITSRNAGYRSYFVSTSTYNRICLIVLLFLYF